MGDPDEQKRKSKVGCSSSVGKRPAYASASGQDIAAWHSANSSLTGALSSRRRIGSSPSPPRGDELCKDGCVGGVQGSSASYRHFVEKLSQNEELNLGRETVRRILRAAGIGSPRKRRRIKHRARRERRAQAGMMILWDGSRHDWLEGRGPILTLMGAIDDATNEMLPGMRFYLQESAEGYLRLLYEIARNKGLPQSAYGDKHGSLCRNDDHWSLEEELRGEQDPTQVGEAMRALCIEKIDAHSPQAKGRIERPWGTLQDRLVSELRLAKVSTLEHANAILERERISHNQRFAIPAREHATAWRPLPKTLDLERACSFRYEATVKNDNTVQIAHYIINIPPGPKGRTYAKAQVEVRQLLDGTWRVYLKDVIIATAPRENIGELRVKKPRKRNAASRAFRKAVIAI
jgi:hypothetical protein